MFSYSVGVIPAAILASIVAVGSFVRLLRGGHRLTPLLALGVGSAAFAAFYAILNAALQISSWSVPLLQAEMTNGRLALRFTSLAVATSYVLLILRALQDAAFKSPGGENPTGALKAAMEENERARSWPLDRAADQGAVFMVALAILWGLTIASRSSVEIALLNWSLAFIVDDFVMAANYRHARGVKPPTFDLIKINVVSLFVIALFIVVAFQEFSLGIAITATVTIAAILFIIPGMRNFARNVRLIWMNIGIFDWDDPLDDPENARDNADAEEGLRKLLELGILSQAEYDAKSRMLEIKYASPDPNFPIIYLKRKRDKKDPADPSM